MEDKDEKFYVEGKERDEENHKGKEERREEKGSRHRKRQREFVCLCLKNRCVDEIII